MPIFDQGYQHWNGPLSGHAWRWLAVARHGVRATFKNRFVRWFLFAAWVPALALVAALAVWGLLEQQSESVLAFLKPLLPAEMVGQPRDFRAAVWTIAYSFFFKAELAGALFLVLVVGPTLVSRDLRFNALPLYFSRPLRRADYVWAKIGAAVTGIWLLYAGPLLLLVVSGLFTVDTWTERIDEVRSFAGGLALAAIYAVVYASIGLVLSAFLRRRMVASAVIVGYFLLTTAVGAVVGQVVGPPRGDTIGRLFGPSRMVAGLESYLWRAPTEGIGPPPQAGPGLFIVRFHPPGPVFLLVAIGLVLVCVVVMHLRYRRVRT